MLDGPPAVGKSFALLRMAAALPIAFPNVFSIYHSIDHALPGAVPRPDQKRVYSLPSELVRIAMKANGIKFTGKPTLNELKSLLRAENVSVRKM